MCSRRHQWSAASLLLMGQGLILIGTEHIMRSWDAPEEPSAVQAEGLRQDLRQRDARVAELEQRLLQTAGACRRCRGMHGWQRRDDS